MQTLEIPIADFFNIGNFCCLYFFIPDKEMNTTLFDTTF